MSGWFSVKHGIRNHPIFKGRPDRLGAWVSILDEAAYADTQQDVAGEIVTVRRGELCASQAMLEEITGLPRQQLRSFLSALEKSGAITTRPATKSTKSRTILTVCNYGKYQHDQPSDNQEPTKDQPIKKTNKQIPPSEDAPASSLKSVDVDPINKAVWDFGVPFLSANGVKNPRPVIGGWLRDYPNPTAVLEALRDAQRSGTKDPIPYIKAVLGNGSDKRKPYKTDVKGRPEIGSTMVNKRGEHLRYVNHFDGWMREYA